MKKFDLVRLVNDKDYKNLNLEKDIRGVVLGRQEKLISVLFFNPHNTSDYAIIDIKKEDLTLEKAKLPLEVIEELSKHIENIKNKANSQFTPIKIKLYDNVELLVEENRYAKFGIHKGDIGCVMDNNAIQNYIEVDFSGINEKGEYYGECISVKISDLKVLD